MIKNRLHFSARWLLVPALLLSFAGMHWLTGQVDREDQSVLQSPHLKPQSEPFPTYINVPPGLPLVDSGRQDTSGRPMMVSCGTCHDTRPPDSSVNAADQLDEFHRGLSYNHGGLSCLACHNSENYTMLRLADGTAVGMPDSIVLCGQCHGPQLRDYENGAHGGMMGYWDLTQGPRYRNHCVDCHDPHIPAFPQVNPVFAPHDRMPAGHRSKETSHE